jgi:hypothetical protein
MDSILAACARTPCALVCGPCELRRKDENFVETLKELKFKHFDGRKDGNFPTFQRARTGRGLIDPWPRLPCRTWRRHVATAALFTLESSIGQRRGQS